MLPIIQTNEVAAELSRRSFHHFVKSAWAAVDQAPFVDSLLVGAVCEHMQAVHEGEITNLVINIPPRHAKSMLVCVMFHAWVWANKPEQSFIYATSRQDLTLRDARKARRLIQSSWYQRSFGALQLQGDENAMGRYTNEYKGSRQSFSLSSYITGDGAHYRIIDDPTDASITHNDRMLRDANDWWDESASTRILDPDFAPVVLIMQRLSPNDMSGYFVNELGFEHLCLPFRYEKSHPTPSKTSLGFKDWRENDGEILDPGRWSEIAATKFENSLRDNADGQLQQRPIKREGKVFKESHFGSYESQTWFDRMIITADTAAATEKDSDWSVFQLWGKHGKDIYLVDQIRGQWDADRLLDEAIKFIKKYDGKIFGTFKMNVMTHIENKSSGIGLIQQLRNRQIRVSKIQRGKVQTKTDKGYDPKQGNIDDRVANLIYDFGEDVKLPIKAPWIAAFKAEFSQFEYGKDTTDDQISATLDAVGILKNKSGRAII